MARRLTLSQAKTQYVHRFTMEHVPAWACKRPCDSGGTETRYYAPQFRTDAEWYENTVFPGEKEAVFKDSCYTRNQSWPLGQWLDKPFVR
jgi:hypothetical protein